MFSPLTSFSLAIRGAMLLFELCDDICILSLLLLVLLLLELLALPARSSSTLASILRYLHSNPCTSSVLAICCCDECHEADKQRINTCRQTTYKTCAPDVAHNTYCSRILNLYSYTM
jgi:hypothetical protein